MEGSSQDRRQQPGQADPEAEPERPLVEFPGRDAAAEREVLAQHGLDSGRERSVRHHDRQLEVEAERAVVEIGGADGRSEEHTSELQSLMRISYALFCLKKKTTNLSSVSIDFINRITLTNILT